MKKTTKQPLEDSKVNGEVLKRTFAAKNYHIGSPIRKKLNEESLTSEYMPSYKYEGRIYHPETETNTAYTSKQSFRTKTEAEEYVIFNLKKLNQ